MKNVGTLDKIARLVIGAILIALVFVGPKTPWGWIGAVLILTALVNWCPIYSVLKMKTTGKS